MSATASSNPMPEIPLACNLDALSAEQRSQHLVNASHLLTTIAQERRESADGFSFRFKAADYARVVDFVANERLCCPFFHFVLEVPPGSSPLWLHIKGGEDTKVFLKAELALG